MLKNNVLAFPMRPKDRVPKIAKLLFGRNVNPERYPICSFPYSFFGKPRREFLSEFNPNHKSQLLGPSDKIAELAASIPREETRDLPTLLMFVGRSLCPLNLMDVALSLLDPLPSFWYNFQGAEFIASVPRILEREPQDLPCGGTAIVTTSIIEPHLVAIALLRKLGYPAVYAHASYFLPHESQTPRIVILDKTELVVFSLDLKNTPFGALLLYNDFAVEMCAIDQMRLSPSFSREIEHMHANPVFVAQAQEDRK